MTSHPPSILIVEDRDLDRKFLAALLRSSGYHVVEAADGGQALDLLRDQAPALVVSDILMPSVDGYEFVRQMRDDLGMVDTPVIFYTATYHEREARVLAEQCGVAEVLVKPSPANVILDSVARVLATPAAPAPVPPGRETFDRDHFRVVHAALSDRTMDLEVSRQRLAAIIELTERLGSELNPEACLAEACRAARDVAFAQTAVLGHVADDGAQRLIWSGVPGDQAARLKAPTLSSGLLLSVLDARSPVRHSNPTGRPEALGLPPDYPRTFSLLAVPIATARRVYGWLGLLNKLGAAEFSAPDEQVALTVGRHAAIAYENARLAADRLSRTEALEAEVGERRRAERELRANQERTEFALAAGHMGVFDVDFRLGRMTWSRSAANLFGRPPDEVPASLLEALERVHPDDRAAVREAVERSQREGADFAMEVRTLWPDGVVHWVDCRARILRDDGGVPSGALGVIIDVDERRLLEAQVQQAQRLEAIGQLAGGLAHDFNNALTTVIGYAGLLAKEFDAGDPKAEDVAEILRAAEGASRVTRQLLALGRRHVVQAAVVDVNQVVHDAAKVLERLLPATIELRWAVADAEASVQSDAGLLEQLLMNLALNARDAMPDGGLLRIVTDVVAAGGAPTAADSQRGSGAFVRLTVQDSGIGMDEEVKRRLFDPFFTTKAPGQGSGLGLATVQGIVRQSRGHIWVDSAPGQGSTFRVYLPRVEGEPAATERPAAAPAARGSETVLVVEDERAVRYLVRTILARQGYQVFEADGPDRAMEWLAARHDRLDLLISDVIMPGGTGPALYERVRATWPHVRVLFMSGYTDDAGAQAAGGQLGGPLLQKPFAADELSRKVREVLEQ
jgi:PAS domain S-box-containing protein